MELRLSTRTPGNSARAAEVEVDAAEEGDVLDEAFDACFEKPEAMQVLPDDVFALVCRFLVT